MFHFNFYLSYNWLYWTRPTGPPSALPAGIERSFVQTPQGAIELLCAKPSTTNSSISSKKRTTASTSSSSPPASSKRRRATSSSSSVSSSSSSSSKRRSTTTSTPNVVVFAHGGMGSAWVWAPYMLYLAEHGVTSYAISTRGHGESWHPSFLRMLYGVTKRDLGDDLVVGIKAVQGREGGGEIVLVGHSSGGGLSQFLVNEGDVKVKGLGLLGAVPGNGSYKVYYNWACFDPWFVIRMIFHGWHSNSPLSHPFLIRQAFFSEEYPEEDLLEFQQHMNRYESFWWPTGMLAPFVNVKKLLRNITGWNGSSDRILIMAGTGDKLMTRDVQIQAAQTYRSAVSDMVGAKKLEPDDAPVRKLEGEGGKDDSGQGIRLAWVPGAGHHVQNDVQWKVGAAKLLSWLEQL
ncbi:Alpha/Beta hydrolase protein [Apiospora arundinis]|uniref:Alpha/Beta hydrolase protein n=1 Tax=Apiospora arundinis TaxID=335852 RepID=A0ABR2IGR1_9PEZI